MENTQQTKLAAIVFTDIVGYTQKMDSDEMLTMRYLDKQREIVYPIVQNYGGKVLKEIGDGLLIMFDSAVQAVRCTVEIQTKLKDEEFQIRAGIHMGDVIMKDGDVFGAAVNIAARIEPQAKPGGVCISEGVRNQIRNKIDFRTVSKGVKELKGVSEPIEVYDVLFGNEEEQKAEKISLLKHLWQRRVPHITGIYCLLVLFIYFALEYISSNYLLSPHLVKFGAILLLSLMPSVILISYFHGKAASGEWKNIERFGLPINLIISAVILFSVFNDKDLGATTTSVNIIDENGQTIEREIIKSEFRKSMTIFLFENTSDDASINWMQVGLPFMIGYDLVQDVFIRSESVIQLKQEISDEGYSPEEKLPLIIEQKIANQRHSDYFINGKIHKNSNSEYAIDVSVYQTNTSKLTAQKSYSGANIFELVDQISKQLKFELKIPESHIEEVRDLPISEMLTSSESSMRDFTLLMTSRFFENDFDAAQIHGNNAIAADDSFILAHAQMVDIYLSTSQKQLSDEAFEKVMQNIIRLPEQIQFRMKYSYYLLIEENPEKAIAVVKMWKDLYPQDIQAYELAANLYQLKNEPNLAIAEFEEIMKLDPSRYYNNLSIANLYSSQAKYDEAIKYNKKYADRFPESSDPYLAIGHIYFKLRDFDLARYNYEKVLMIEHDNTPASIGLADIELIEGEYLKAEQLYLKMLEISKTPQDRSGIYGSLAQLYELRGQMEQSLESLESKYDEMAKHSEPSNVIINRAVELDSYVKAGKSDLAFKIAEELKSKLASPIDKFISLGYMAIYLELKDVEAIEATILEIEDAIRSFHYEILTPYVTSAKAEVFLIKEEYEKAIEQYKAFLIESPQNLSMNAKIAMCYRELGDYPKAMEYMNIVMNRSPFVAEINYEMALIYSKQGQNEKALDYLKIALKTWENADVNYQPAKLAQEKYLELSM